jgi:hypothetical protein
VLKILGAKRIVIHFREIGRQDMPALIEDLET